jgi:predicted metal-dependent phosphoesterase TrpH
VLKVELHTHTADDPVDRIPHSSTALIDRAAALGFDALAITLHERQLDVRWLVPYAAERGIVLIPGVERSIEGRHVLLLNFPRLAENIRTFDDLGRLKQHHPQGLVVAPHPFFPGATCLGRQLDAHAGLFDAVEWNAMYTRHVNFNERAWHWAATHGKPLVANGDVHRLEQLGTAFSLVDATPDAETICRAVRAGRVVIQTEAITLARAVWTMADLFVADLMQRSRRLVDVDRSREIGVNPR